MLQSIDNNCVSCILKFFSSECLLISAWLTAVRTFEIFGLVTSFIFVVTLTVQLAAKDGNLKGKARISNYFLSVSTGKFKNFNSVTSKMYY